MSPAQCQNKLHFTLIFLPKLIYHPCVNVMNNAGAIKCMQYIEYIFAACNSLWNKIITVVKCPKFWTCSGKVWKPFGDDVHKLTKNTVVTRDFNAFLTSEYN